MTDAGFFNGQVSDGLAALKSNGNRFGTIYADPPWAYSNTATRSAARGQYGTMSIEELCALDVAAVLAPTAHLHIWTTNAFLFETKRVMEAWGFEYKSVLVWIKPQFGIGNYWRVGHEFLLLGTHGPKATFSDHRRRSWVMADRIGHSRKPVVFRDLIEAVSPQSRLELFGRVAHPNWFVIGDQISKGAML